MSSGNVNDDKQMGNKDKDQKAGADRQRQQSTGQPGGGQQGSEHANRNTQQSGSGQQGGVEKSSDSDPNRKGGKM